MSRSKAFATFNLLQKSVARIEPLVVHALDLWCPFQLQDSLVNKGEKITTGYKVCAQGSELIYHYLKEQENIRFISRCRNEARMCHVYVADPNSEIIMDATWKQYGSWRGLDEVIYRFMNEGGDFKYPEREPSMSERKEYEKLYLSKPTIFVGNREELLEEIVELTDAASDMFGFNGDTRKALSDNAVASWDAMIPIQSFIERKLERLNLKEDSLLANEREAFKFIAESLKGRER